MAFGMSTKARTSPIAIDFGADGLKVMQVNLGEPNQLITAGVAHIPESARQDTVERMIFLEDALKGLLRNLPVRGRKALCSIPAFQMLLHNFELPRCDAEDTNSLVELQLRDRLGLEPSRLVIQNFRGAEMPHDGTMRQDVVTLAGKRDLIMQYLQLAGRCKLEVIGMHPEPLATVKAFEHLTGTAEQPRPILLVDLGAATTKVIIVHGPKVVLMKTIHAGGDHFVQRVAKQSSLSFHEARQHRIAQNSGAVGVMEPRKQTTCEITDTLIDELKLSLRFHHSRYPSQPIERVVFLGGGAMDRALGRKLAQSLGLAAQLGDPFATLQKPAGPTGFHGLDQNHPQPAWAVALGLCLSEPNL